MKKIFSSKKLNQSPEALPLMNGGLIKAIHYNPMENVVPKNIYNFEIINQKIKRNGISFSNAMDYTMEKVIPKSI